MRRKTFVLIAVLAASVAASVAGASTKDVRLSLVAYSTPREAYNKLIPAFQKTQAGNGVSFSQSYAASGDQARAVKAGLKADIVALSLGPGRRRARHRRPRRLQVGPAVVQGHGHQLTRRLHRPGRQPEEDQGLERPDPAGRAGRDAEPVHVGRRPLERDGRVRRAAQARQDRQAGAGLPAEAVQERRLAGQERPRLAADVQRRPRRRAAGLRERGALRPFARPGLAVRDPALDDPDREPDRGREGRATTSRRRTRSSASCARRTRRRSSPRRATGRSARRSRSSSRRSSRHARVSSRSTSSGSAAGTRCRSGSSIRGTESWRGSKGRSEVSPARRADRTVRLRAS